MGRTVKPGELGTSLKSTPGEVRRLLAELEVLGYIERDRDHTGRQEGWCLTNLGMRFVGAAATRPISRQTADRLVREFMARVDEVNRDQDYAYRVRKVIVFGSYLTEIPTLGDVDLAVTLEPKELDLERRRVLEEKRIAQAVEAGRSFSTFLEQLDWPQREVLMRLKGGSRAIKIHSGDDAVLKRTRTRVLFKFAGNVR